MVVIDNRTGETVKSGTVDYNSPNLYGEPKYTGNVTVKSKGKIIYDSRGAPVGRVSVDTSTGKTRVSGSSGSTYSGGSKSSNVQVLDENVKITDLNNNTTATVSKADADRGFFSGTLAEYVKQTNSNASQQTLSNAGLVVETQNRTAGEILKDLRSKTSNLKPNQAVYLRENKPAIENKAPAENVPEWLINEAEKTFREKNPISVKYEYDGKTYIFTRQKKEETQKNNDYLKNYLKGVKFPEPEVNLNQVYAKQNNKGQDTISIPFTSSGIGNLETDREKLAYSLSFPTARTPDVTKADISKFDIIVKGGIQKGKFGSGLQQYEGLTQSHRLADGSIQMSGTGLGLKVASNIGTFALAGAGVSAGISALAIKYPKAIATVSKIGKVTYTASVPVRAFTNRNNPQGLILEFSKDVGFIAGANAFKINSIGYNDGGKSFQNIKANYQYKIQQDRIVQVSKIDRYGNVYDSVDISASPGQKNLFGTNAKVSRELPTGFKQVMKGYSNTKGFSFKTDYLPKDYVILDTKGGKVTASFDVQGVRPVFKGNQIVGYKNIGSTQSRLANIDEVVAKFLKTGQKVTITKDIIKFNDAGTFFKVDGKYYDSSNFDQFRTVGKRTNIFNKNVVNEPKSNFNSFDITKGSTQSKFNINTGNTGTIQKSFLDNVKVVEVVQKNKFIENLINSQKTLNTVQTKPAPIIKESKVILAPLVSQTKTNTPKDITKTIVENRAKNRSKSESSFIITEVNKIDDKDKILISSKNLFSQTSITNTKNRSKEVNPPKIFVNSRSNISSGLDQSQGQKQKPIDIIKPIVISPPVPIIDIKLDPNPIGSQITPEIIKPVIPNPFKNQDLTKRNRSASGYNVFVKSRGNFYKANIKPLKFSDAKSFGMNVVSNTASATFKLTKAVGGKLGRFTGFKGNPNDFRESKKSRNTFIQKLGKRIQSVGEKKEITYKGILSRRKLKKIWGL